MVLFLGKKDGDILGKGWEKMAFGAILALALLTFVLMAMGWWQPIYDFIFGRTEGAQIWINILLIAVIAGAIIAVLVGGKKE